jgi:lipopolysaccharide/colanic/teichoic acid biosynthesis glycosyltransferase
LHRFTNRVLKRSIDIVGSIAGLILSVPIYVVCGIIIYLESPGPIVFGQDRMGRQGRIFKMYKLRSMRLGAETTDHLNQSTPHEDGRLLRCGKFMRAWNLDETPQFWNVLKGDMSLVGPRPERVYHSEHLRQKIPHYCARHITAPGMSGWAQVNGFRGGTDLEARIRYDLYYLENWSIWLDVRIIIRTFLTHKNAY